MGYDGLDRWREVEPSDLRRGMRVVGSGGGIIGVVEAVDAMGLVELRSDAEGTRHFIPLAWVTRVDVAVHVDRPRTQVMHEWASDPTAA